MNDQDLLAKIVGTGGDPADLPFWTACREGKFMLHQCEQCGTNYWPASRCVTHGDQAMRWVEGSGRGTLYTYTVMHHAYMPEMKDKLPYVVAVVKMKEGPFFHSNLTCGPEAVRVGMPLQAEMTVHANGMTVPIFRPVEN